MHDIVEDYSDLVGGEDESVLESKVADFKVCFLVHVIPMGAGLP